MNFRANRWVGAAVAAVALSTAQAASAQVSMPNTLRYGSGYLDNPAASVLPHLNFQVNASGFWSNEAGTPPFGIAQVGRNARPSAALNRVPALNGFNSDISWAVGLFDRAEIGGSLFGNLPGSSGPGNTLWGAFAQVNLLQPGPQEGFGLAVGGRYNAAPGIFIIDETGARSEVVPNRLGVLDTRVREGYPETVRRAPGAGLGQQVFDGTSLNTQTSFYMVGTFFTRGFQSDWFPENDFTFSVGYGTGMFQAGSSSNVGSGQSLTPFYTSVSSDGFFASSSMAIELSETSLLHLISEWNGFELNLGAQADLFGIKLGAHYLGANYGNDVSIYRSSKWGLSGGLALGSGGLQAPSLLQRPEPEVIQLPAPPADTVVVERTVGTPVPEGTMQTICLATGQSTEILITAQGDTLVGRGESYVNIADIRPGVVFAGTYADGRDWFTAREDVVFEERNYSRSGNSVSLNCSNIMRVGEYQGVPLFVTRSADRPYETVYVPVSPGVWQAYQTLRGPRG